MNRIADEPQPADCLDRLQERLRSPAFRRIPGFSQGTDEHILALSEPPHFTACPNPSLGEFVRRHQRPDDEPPPSNPFAGDLCSSARHPVHAFHPYHTKVPPEIIRTVIEHYTRPGDVVLDAFAGSGMTGVAAREAGRHAVLIDLSPAATFIASINCRSHDPRAIESLHQLVTEAEATWGHLYETEQDGRGLTVNHYVWSDVFSCPLCRCTFPFFPHGVVHHRDKVETRPSFACPGCAGTLTVRRVQRVLDANGKRKALVWVNAGTGLRRVSRPASPKDVERAQLVESLTPAWHPTDAINPDGYSARLAQLGDKAITDVSRLLSRRNLIVFADLWERAGRLGSVGARNLGRALLTSIFTVISERQGYFGGGGGMSGNLYMPIVRMEKNICAVLRRKLRKLQAAERAKRGLAGAVLVSTQSATDLSAVPDASIDYVFTDPPFGANIIYSEMNLALEAWLRVRTNAGPEAVIDASRQRGIEDYAELMRRSFREYFRVLKPGRWLTVAFHSTSAEVWNSLQEAVGAAGFEVAQVSLLDKGNTTILADIRPTAMRGDLLLTASKPAGARNGRFRLHSGAVEGVWEFVRNRLNQLGERDDERTAHRLYDRLVAWHVRDGRTVPVSSVEFHNGLRRHFTERAGRFYAATTWPVP